MRLKRQRGAGWRARDYGPVGSLRGLARRGDLIHPNWRWYPRMHWEEGQQESRETTYEATVTCQVRNEHALTDSGICLGYWIDKMCYAFHLNTQGTHICFLSQTVSVVTKTRDDITKNKNNILTSSSTFTELNSTCECECCEMWCCLYFRSALNCWIGFITFLRYVSHCSDNSCSMVRQN